MTEIDIPAEAREMAEYWVSDMPGISELTQAIADLAARVRAEREWRPMDSAPKDGAPFLAWLEKPMLGSQCHAAKIAPAAVGFVTIVGGVFGHDAPKMLKWMPLPAPPKETE